jgi:uncharacterized membrane protein YuzA (DUF378 family)
MAILQALFSLLSRSLGKILNAVFGWAVVALFGQTSPAQKTLLSGLVGLAALWPLLVLGVIVPRVATAALAFVPPSAQGPAWFMRSIWIALSLLVPMSLGLVVASKAPPGSPKESFAKRLLRGFPITVGLAGAFLLTFATVPLLRVVAMLKRHKDEHVPLVTSADAYDQVAGEIDDVLARHRITAVRTEPPWWLSAPTRILLAMGGRAFRGFVPRRLAHWRGPGLQIALYPSDLLVRGAPRVTAWIHGLTVERLARTPALQTMDPAAQDLERQLRRVWKVYEENREAHEGSDVLVRRLANITDQLGSLDISYEEWSVLYRQCGQLGRALEGKPQLLAKEDDMPEHHERPAVAPVAANPAASATQPGPQPIAALPTRELLAEAAKESVTLLRTELELAKTELKEDLKSEVAAAKGLSVAAVCALCVLNLLLVSVALALTGVVAPWAAPLLVAAGVALVGAVAGAFGWKHVRMPLARTRKTVEEDIRWAKERTA